MYRCILVPLDGTAFGEGAIPHAVAIARRCGAVLQLAHVHLPPIIPSGAETAALPPVWIEMSSEEKKHYLQSLAERVRAASGVRVETRVMEGGVVPALEQHARRCEASLIVMSTHGHVGMSRLWHHGIADQLARDLPIPVLLVRAKEAEVDEPELPEPPFANILVPLDGSADSELIIEHAVSLGRVCSARFTLARVVKGDADADGIPAEESVGAWSATSGHDRTAARQYLNALAERLRSRSLDVSTEVLTGGPPAHALVEFVRQSRSDPARRIDVIAVESSARGSVTRLFWRGTADELIRDSPVPVLLFQVARTAAAGLVAEPGLVGRG